MSHFRVYESALNEVRYVYGKPVPFDPLRGLRKRRQKRRLEMIRAAHKRIKAAKLREMRKAKEGVRD